MNSPKIFAQAMALFCVLALSACKPNQPAPQAGGDGGAAQPTASGKKHKIAFVSNGVASFWTICEAGVKAAGKDLGVDSSMYMPAEGIGDQKRIIEDLLTRGIDGISISPIDADNQTEMISKAAEHAKIITADSDAPKANRLLYLGMDNYKAGRL
jgi:ribose transport system substrate-binding protein